MRTLVFLVAAVNPARVALALPRRGRLPAAATAALATLAVVVGLAAASDAIVEALDVSSSTFRIAAGAVAAIGGLVRLVVPNPDSDGGGDSGGDSGGDGWAAGLVPLAFPTLLTPDVALLAVSLGADEGVAQVAVGSAVALGLVVAAALAPPPASRRAGAAVTGLVRLLAAVLVVAGVALAVDGVQDL